MIYIVLLSFSVYLSYYLSIILSISPSVCAPVYLSIICLSVCLSACPSVYRSICLSILSVCRSICLSLYLSIDLSAFVRSVYHLAICMCGLSFACWGHKMRHFSTFVLPAVVHGGLPVLLVLVGFSFRGVAKRWAILLWSFDIFLIFPDFLGFYVVRTLVR